MNSSRRALLIPGLISLLFALGCGGAFMEGFQEGMESSARDSLAEARAAVAQCPAGPDRDALNAVLDRVEISMADGSISGLDAAMIGGMVTGGVDDGCDAGDIEVIRSTYPSVVP